MYVKT